MERDAFVRELASVLRVDPAALRPEFRLEEGVWDSLAVMSVVALVDEHCGLTLSGEELARSATVGDVLRLAGLD
jgi:acyl carrier protein